MIGILESRLRIPAPASLPLFFFFFFFFCSASFLEWASLFLVAGEGELVES